MEYVRLEQQGLVGYITLDRPKALNSIDLDMIRAIHSAIVSYENNTSVDVIVIRSSSERAFCAGGDMKVTRDQALAEDWPALREFFEIEYALNLHISQCSKPYVSLVAGIAMGGGLGLTVHGDVMVVSETTRLAMPETAIGFFPDVGGTHFLSRLPYEAGMWLGLTGIPVKGKDAVTVGIASHYVPQADWPALIKALEADGRQALDTVLPALTDNSHDTAFIETLKQRQNWFVSGNDAQTIQTLKAASTQSEDAAKLLARLYSVSPYAVSLSRKLIDKAFDKDLAACLQMELEAGEEAVRHPDFVEGIRAVLVDKNEARWTSSYPRL